MADFKDAFSALGGYQNKRISNANEFAELAGASEVLQYPRGLGGTPSTPATFKGIPFTLFMPYKRARGLDAYRSTLQTQTLFTQMPTPEFAIALPTPTSALKTEYGVEYDKFDIGSMIGGVIAQLDGGTRDQLNNITKDGYSSLSALQGSAQRAVDIIKNKVTTPSGRADMAEGSANLLMGGALNLAQFVTGSPELIPTAFGLAENPYTEYAFKNVQPRTHTFSYVFMPRSQDESQVIDRIINVFKYSMLPRPSSAAGFFQFPYEFQIVHSVQNTTFALLPSVLKLCEVDYSGGTDSPKFFSSDYPARITMTMQFQEMVLLNRDYVVKDDLMKNDTGGPDNTYRFRF